MEPYQTSTFSIQARVQPLAAQPSDVDASLVKKEVFSIEKAARLGPVCELKLPRVASSV